MQMDFLILDADGFPHLTSVWFLFDGECLYLAIPSSSAKAKNLMRNRQIAVMVDVRTSYAESGITAVGKAEIIGGEDAVPVVRRLHEKYLTDEALQDPQVGPAFAAIDDIAIQLKPTKWIAWDMAELDSQAFGGIMSQNRYLKDIVP
jgi:nitroimidazol reductase NimA-like FMN-containing flavoprotein (pyridoxamine 5'-phosphate oxidase superfamily)